MEILFDFGLVWVLVIVAVLAVPVLGSVLSAVDRWLS